MSLNLLNPQVGDIIGASSTTYDTPIVEFPIGRFIILRKDRFAPGHGGYHDRLLTCRLLWQKEHYSLVGDNEGENFTITLKDMINSYHRFYLHYRPEEE
jgi:hypothetical protein